MVESFALTRKQLPPNAATPELLRSKSMSGGLGARGKAGLLGGLGADLGAVADGSAVYAPADGRLCSG